MSQLEEHDFFKVLNQVKRLLPTLIPLENRQIFPKLAVVSDNKDPLKLRRILVKDPVLDGVYDSEWILPLRQTRSSDPPVPLIGQKVSLTYIEGDVNRPQYALHHDDPNPVKDKEDPINDNWTSIDGHDTEEIGGDQKLTVEGNRTRIVNGNEKVDIKGKFTITVGDEVVITTESGAKITMTSSGRIKLSSDIAIEIAAPLIKLEGQTKINSKEVCVLGGSDDRGHNFVNSGQ